MQLYGAVCAAVLDCNAGFNGCVVNSEDSEG